MTTRLPAWIRRLLLLLTVLLLAAGFSGPALAGDDGPTGRGPVVEILQVSGPLDPPITAAVRGLVEQANERGSEAVVLQLDSPGAVDVDVAEVVAPIRSSDVPVVVWVGPGNAEAAGAAFFLVAASHLPAAATAASLGPACPTTVVDACGPDELALLGALLRERNQAEEGAGLVVDRYAAGVVAGGEAAAGVDVGFVDLVVDGLEPLLVELNGRTAMTDTGPKTLEIHADEVTVRFHNLGLVSRTLHAALDPTVFYLLLVGVLLLAAFELFQPGFGVAGVAAVVLSPLAVYGLIVLPVQWWALGLVVAGLGGLALDLAIAGLGAPSVGGTLALATGSWWLFAGDSPLLRLSPWLVGAVVTFAVVYFVVVMTVVLRAQSGPDPATLGEDLAGRVGTVRSALNPEGHVFVAGALWRARWVGEDRGRVSAGTRVRVVGADGAVLLVDAVEAALLQRASGETTPP